MFKQLVLYTFYQANQKLRFVWPQRPHQVIACDIEFDERDSDLLKVEET